MPMRAASVAREDVRRGVKVRSNRWHPVPTQPDTDLVEVPVVDALPQAEHVQPRADRITTDGGRDALSVHVDPRLHALERAVGMLQLDVGVKHVGGPDVRGPVERSGGILKENVAHVGFPFLILVLARAAGQDHLHDAHVVVPVLLKPAVVLHMGGADACFENGSEE